MGLISVNIDAGLNLTELGEKLAPIIKRAGKKTRVEEKVLLYLQVAQAAVRALGRERQGILSDAAGCNIQNSEQVEALSKRMSLYLQEDNVREPLTKAISGLQGCREAIEKKAQGLRWRRGYKEKTVDAFLSALDELEQKTRDLESKFYPEYSGQGLKTLIPVCNLVVRIRDDLRRDREFDIDEDEGELAGLIRDALRDPAQSEWIESTADIEQLIVELQLAFSIEVDSTLEEA